MHHQNTVECDAFTSVDTLFIRKVPQAVSILVGSKFLDNEFYLGIVDDTLLFKFLFNIQDASKCMC